MELAAKGAIVKVSAEIFLQELEQGSQASQVDFLQFLLQGREQEGVGGLAGER